MTVGDTGDTVTFPATSIANSALQGSGEITINGTAVALGGSINVQSSLNFPTISSISPSTITNSQTSVVITGTNFVSVPQVEAISSTGVIIAADTVTYTSSTSITAAFTITTDGTYFIRVENNNGLAARSSSALLTVSDAPTWTTAAGTLGTFASGSAISVTVAATGDSTIAYSKTTGSFPSGLSLNSSTGVISGTESGSDSSDTTYNFTSVQRTMNLETADRAFKTLLFLLLV